MFLKQILVGDMDNFCYLNSRSGYHYIATGMNYFSVDINHKEMPPNVDVFLKKREQEIKRWNEVCKGKPSLLKFLETNIYNKTSK